MAVVFVRCRTGDAVGVVTDGTVGFRSADVESAEMVDLSTSRRKLVFASIVSGVVVGVAAIADMFLGYPYHPFAGRFGFSIPFLIGAMLVLVMGYETWQELPTRSRRESKRGWAGGRWERGNRAVYSDTASARRIRYPADSPPASPTTVAQSHRSRPRRPPARTSA